ncbi:hypothetical protein NE865_04503 [Phthorimaea operculella]|nr:hypothetical protein NE865_04503 [Phthorimaea operculella]
MSSTMYKAVCARLLQIDYTERINVCCLCLETLEDSGVCIYDEVMLHIPNHPRTEATTVAHIINSITDESVYEVMLALKSVCKTCVAAAINSFTFIQHCKDNAKLFNTCVDNLLEVVDELSEEKINGANSLYVAPESNTLMKRYYDKYRLFVPQDSAFMRFQQIIKNEIAVMDESLVEILCCKKIINIKDLLEDSRKPLQLKCRVCKETFAHENSLRIHFYREHRNKNIKCKKCAPKEISYAALMQKSERTDVESNDEHYNSGGDDWQYDEVPISQQSLLIESTKDKKTLEILRDIKEPVIPSDDGIFSCKKCKQKFSTRNRYIKHITTKQYKCKRPPHGFGEYKCDYCGYTSFYKPQLAKHIRFEHLGEKGFVCEFCGKNFWAGNALEIHTLTHTKEKNYTCEICGKKYPTKYGLKLHSTVHRDDKPFECHVCLKRFKRRDYRAEHFRRNHETEPAFLPITLAKLEKKNSQLMDSSLRRDDGWSDEMHFEEIQPFHGQTRWFQRGQHFFIAYRKLGISTYLRCHSPDCPVTITMKANRPGPERGEHDHPPNPWVRNRNVMFQALKTKTLSPDNTHIPFTKIYEEEALRYPDAAPHLPLSSVMSSMRMWRRMATVITLHLPLSSVMSSMRMWRRMATGTYRPPAPPSAPRPRRPRLKRPKRPTAEE